MIKKLGVQLYTIRGYLDGADQIRSSFTKLKELGYDQVQTAGVASYEMIEIAKELGIEIIGTHTGLQYLEENLETAINDHKLMGTTNCGIGAWTQYDTKEEVQDFIKRANSLADKLYEHGMKFTYHNHSHEFMHIDGKTTIMDMLVDGLNPEKTSFVLDTYWVANAGDCVRHWLEKLEGRVDILHLKDKGYTNDLVSDGKYNLGITEVGNGNLYWDGIIETAEKTGVKYYCVEQDYNFTTGNPFDSIKESAEYLKRYMV